ncbi:DMT family transporter [Albidovulum sediminicola]|uniref:DMT family transporter n=1 Tax=Albidovulum sediminicola TaxID=2984331 RepID=A0ABT2Z2X8_9RHOB|nr:DMT family transporter [Defluviimonas sp. WL0075]MCV2865437.1 DMT family transporter [Defluviimonas sp. WL0075]
MTRHRAGVLLVLASTLPFALAGIFTRAITTDIWTILAWRGLIGGGLVLVYALWREGARPMRARGWLLACVSGAASVAFLSAFRLTSVANVSLIYATAPFAAAALDWVTSREPIRARVMRAALMSCLGVALVVTGGLGQGRVAGDLLALVMTALMAATTILIRRSGDVPVLRAMAAAAIPLTLAGVAFGNPLAVSLPDVALLAGFGASFALATILLTEGARRIPPAEAAFLGGAEVPVAIALAALLLAEWPPLLTWGGGAIVLAAVLMHSHAGMVEERAARTLSSSGR